ncbi:Cellobiohydrolase A [Pseudomonas meliae]|uniref:Cellobiohydrolase A n=1 Tax=Pseudomonas meliae TaxID=86176 RepID=A0A0P9XND5_9PSED|nr:Cellobiohydrolase A [Pseudomonas meliae]
MNCSTQWCPTMPLPTTIRVFTSFMGKTVVFIASPGRGQSGFLKQKKSARNLSVPGTFACSLIGCSGMPSSHVAGCTHVALWSLRDWRSTSINRGGPTTFMVGLSNIMQGLCQLAIAAVQTRIGNARKAVQRLRGVWRMIFPALHWCVSKGLRCKAVRRIARSR